MRALLLILTTMLVTNIAAAPQPAAAQPFPLEVTLTLDRGAYEPGASIGFTVSARNVSREPVTLSFASTQRIDVIIRKDTVVVSRFAATQPVGPGFGTQRWQPGETVLFTGAWMPYTLLGPSTVPGAVPQLLAPSMYTIQAELLSTGLRVPSPSQPLIIGRPTPIGPGCATITTYFGVSMTAGAVAAVVTPAAALRGLWRFEPSVGRYLGFLPVAGAPHDLASVPAGDVVVFCTNAPAVALLPDP